MSLFLFRNPERAGYFDAPVFQGMKTNVCQDQDQARACSAAVGIRGIGGTVCPAVAASANLPAIVFSLYWKRFNTAGALWGMSAGLASSIALILVGPSVRGTAALFPLENPGIISIPLGFATAWLGTVVSQDRSS